MQATKILLAGLIGGIVFFLLGWLLYGFLLASFFETVQTAEAAAVMRADSEMLLGAIFAGNVFGGLLLAIVFGRWAHISTPLTGAKAGGILNGLFACGFDLLQFGTSKLITLQGVVGDVLVYALMGAVAGAVVAWV